MCFSSFLQSVQLLIIYKLATWLWSFLFLWNHSVYLCYGLKAVPREIWLQYFYATSWKLYLEKFGFFWEGHILTELVALLTKSWKLFLENVLLPFGEDITTSCQLFLETFCFLSGKYYINRARDVACLVVQQCHQHGLFSMRGELFVA